MKRFNLKSFREKQGLNQKEMADKLGISKSYYVAIELGNSEPSFRVAEALYTNFHNQYQDIFELLKKGV
jgi:DNA-binding XRE family transcriptional regulator